MTYFDFFIKNIAPYLIIFALIVFSIMMYIPTFKMSYEKGLNPIFEQQQCGAMINSINYTWPFVRFSVYKQFVIIRTCKVYKIHIDKIYDVRNSNLNISDLNSTWLKMNREGIYISHCESNIPNITIWIKNTDPVIKILHSLINQENHNEYT